jgi:hypothetical protein
MSAAEYNEWIADYQIEPWGDLREDLRTATIVQAAIAPHSKKEVKLKDCMLNFEPPKQFDWKATSDLLKARTIALGGKVK